jgi:hypothetical protein
MSHDEKDMLKKSEEERSCKVEIASQDNEKG